MKTSAKKILGLAALVSASLVASSISANATGTIGKRHVSAFYQYMWVESSAFDDGKGYSVFANTPINLGTKLDLGVGYERLEKTSAYSHRPDITTQEAQLFATLIGPTTVGTPYLRLGLGYGDEKGSDGTSKDDGIYSISAGAEMLQSEQIALTAYMTWTDSIQSNIGGRLTFGGFAELSPSEHIGILLHLEGDDQYNFAAGIGAVLRF